MAERRADVAIVGAGILGLAHALAAAKQGRKVVVFERDPQPLGASVRNFGMIFPIGTTPGRAHNLALRSREVWLELAAAVGFWHDPVGTLIVAYHEDELAVMAEFAQQAATLGYACQLLGRDDVLAQSGAVQSEGLLGGLRSQAEVAVDPREVMGKLPGYLQERYGVRFCFGTAVTHIAPPALEAGGEVWQADRIIVCSGADFETLYPAVFRESGLTRCKLQVMRTEPQPGGWRMGPMLATGFSLKHYAAFAACPSLDALRVRLARDFPELEKWGIHFLVSQNGQGELTLGDSHEYGLAVDPFNRTDINELMLQHIRRFLKAPSFHIAQRWQGVYAKHSSPDPVVFEPEATVSVVIGIGGLGMTTSFGLAEEVLKA